jgi:lysozyme family protein
VPPGTFGLPYIGETLAFLRACKANKIIEDFVNPRVAKYGQASTTGSHGILFTQWLAKFRADNAQNNNQRSGILKHITFHKMLLTLA